MVVLERWVLKAVSPRDRLLEVSQLQKKLPKQLKDSGGGTSPINPSLSLFQI